RTSNLIVGIRSNDSDEQSSILAGTIDGTGERVIISDPRRQPETTPSLVTGIAERKIDMSIFGTSDFDIQSDPSTVTGVAERIVELEKGIGIPSVTPWQEIIQGNSFDWSLREGYNNDSSLGWNNGIVNDERNYTGIFNLPFVDKDFYGRTKNVYEIRSPQMSTNGEPDSLGAGIDPSKPSRLTNRFVRLDSDAPWTGEFETYYQPAQYYEGWDSTAKSGIAALFNLYDSSGDLIGQPARWNRTPQNWVVYREYRDPTHSTGRRQATTQTTPYKLTAAGSQYHKDHDLAWSDSGGFDLDNGYRYPRQLFYYPFYNGENQASFYREGPHPGKWSYVFWGADDWIVFINEDVSPSQLAEGYAFNYRNVTVDVGRYYNLNVDFSPPLNVQEAFDSTVHRGWHNFPFEDIYSTSFTSNPTRSLWRSPQGQFDFDLIGGLRTGPVLQDSDAQIELA
ncbi:MAG: hypothetical protein EB168_10655, partial [Euryarchaeota archaeon]|nr:hypothetical protein [Euryarchaeota archaeon]